MSGQADMNGGNFEAVCGMYGAFEFQWFRISARKFGKVEVLHDAMQKDSRTAEASIYNECIASMRVVDMIGEDDGNVRGNVDVVCRGEI
jgi:hypothetical protein